jgi:uracil-DNA glycosylase
MPDPAGWQRLNRGIVRCVRCPRLRTYCRQVAREKRAAFRQWTYWGRPVPHFGGPDARLLVVGLAPAAHGGNRTGRMFTGDRSGDFLYAAMHAAGFASQPTSINPDDGLELRGAVITAALHCAPPGNKPATTELANCFEHLTSTAALLKDLRVCVALGRIAFDACIRLYRAMGWDPLRPAPRFAHGAVYTFDTVPALIGSYHPSQQNTFTGKLTLAMLTGIFTDAAKIADARTRRPGD